MDNTWNISGQRCTWNPSQQNNWCHWAGFLRPKENVRTLNKLFKDCLLRVQSASDHEGENTENKITAKDFRGDDFYD